MKRITWFFVFIVFNTPISLYSRVGCMDNSWHLEKQYDYKEHHPVYCLCPCPDTIKQCIQCGHCHDPKPWVIINNTQTSDANDNQLNIQDPVAILKKLVRTYKKDISQ